MAPFGLAVATALFVAWRLSEVSALVDIAYILNTASRIAGGDVPYADFRLAHPPLTFAVQAALIRAVGPAYPVHIAYAAVVGGVATALAYTVALRVLRDVVERPRALAAVLCVPLVPLGLYSIVPHPHYDPDAHVAVLAALALAMLARERRAAPWWVAAGAAMAVPLFVKQNIGGAFLPVALAAIAADAAARRAPRDLAWCAVGAVGALGLGLAVIQAVAGIDRYFQWTVAYAFAERGVLFGRVGWFTAPLPATVGLLVPVLAVAAAALRPRAAALLFGVAGGVALAIPAGTNVALLWVPLAIAGVITSALVAIRGRLELTYTLPVVCAGTLAGTLQSQGLGGSSFAAFPLLVVSVASTMRGLRELSRGPGIPAVFGASVALLLLVTGTAYTLGNERLAFADASAPGPVHRSTVATLAGLSARGPYVAEVDAIVGWVRANVADGEPVTFIPGEDPINFALGLPPGLPVVQYIDGSLPYTAEELARIADATGLRWVIVKDDMQFIEGAPPEAIRAQEALTRGADVVAVVGPYRIHRRP